uniref:SCP domain-containing protein n=1 Tax=Chenopodium quinoa TaxID=63459 RepID=A0A803M9G0_CHEQI
MEEESALGPKEGDVRSNIPILLEDNRDGYRLTIVNDPSNIVAPVLGPPTHANSFPDNVNSHALPLYQDETMQDTESQISKRGGWKRKDRAALLRSKEGAAVQSSLSILDNRKRHAGEDQMCAASVKKGKVADVFKSGDDGHNAARRDVGVDPYTWDKKLEAYAQDFANKKPSCSTDLGSKIPYGINLGIGYGFLSSGQSIGSWVGQKSDYNYPSNSCAKGKDCSAYTQVVWRKSVRLGCASVTCGLWPLFVCVYDPAGNIPGEKPY